MMNPLGSMKAKEEDTRSKSLYVNMSLLWHQLLELIISPTKLTGPFLEYGDPGSIPGLASFLSTSAVMTLQGLAA